MKFKLYTAAVVALMLFSCKNEATSEAVKKGDTTAVAKDGAAKADTLPEKAAGPETAPGEAAADGKVLLRLNYSKGFKQEVVYDMFTSAKQMKAKINMRMIMEVVSVKSGDNPVYAFNGEITGMKMDSDAMGRKMKYDSSKKTANMTEQEKMMDEQLGQVINQPMTYSLDSKGKMVTEVKLKSKSGANQSQPFDMGNYQVAFPDEPVGIGESWTKEIKSKQAGGMVINTYTVKEITDTTVVVAVKTVMPAREGGEKSTLAGSYTLDRKTGMLLKGDMKGKLPMMGATINMTFTGKQIK